MALDLTARVPLGASGLIVSRLGLGTAPLGGLFAAVDDATAEATVERAWARGVRTFDTAPLYGHGLAEQRLGRVLSSRPRHEFVLSTKVGRLLRPHVPPDPTQWHDGQPFYHGVPDVNPVFDFTAEGVQQALIESLERLGLDRVDVVHVHDPDDHMEQARKEAIPALCALRDAGRISAVGVGMNDSEPLTQFVEDGAVDCVLVAGRYTLLDQSALDDLLPACAARDVGVFVGGVYNSGILADPHGRRRTFDYVPAPPEVIERALRLETVCARHGVPLKAAAVAFPQRHPAVSCVLLGARSVGELEENLDLAARPIPAALWDDLLHDGLLPDTVPLSPTD